MPKKPRPPIPDPPPRLRQRWRIRAQAWRIWWEPSQSMRALGMHPVEFSDQQLTRAVREAKRLNRTAAKKLNQKRPAVPALAPRTGTMAALIRDYLKSPAWDDLKPATKADYRNSHKVIERKWGEHRVVAFTKPMIYNWYEALYATGKKTYAKALIMRMSGLFSYGERKGYCTGNPALRLGMYQPAPRQRIASWPEIDALLDAAKPWPSMACAIALAVFMGQRQKDLIEAKQADFAGDVWKFVRSKRSNHGAIDVHPEVLPYLQAAMKGHEGAEHLLISEITNRPYSGDYFRKSWAKVRAAAAMELPELADFQFRDLRRTAAHLARLGGASARDVADLLGNNAHKDMKLSGTYMPANHQSASNAARAIRRPAGAHERKVK